MRVIRPGNTAPEQDFHCTNCNAEFVFSKSDVRVATDRVYTDKYIRDDYYFDTKSYYVYCPCCGHKQDVSAWARDWFE